MVSGAFSRLLIKLIITILIVQMFSAEAIIMWTERALDSWSLLNTIAGLLLVYIATVLLLTIWTLPSSAKGVPIDLAKAGMTDGFSRAGNFWNIAFPPLAPDSVFFPVLQRRMTSGLVEAAVKG